VVRVGFLPDGRHVFTSSAWDPEGKQGVTTFWDVPGPWPGDVERVRLELQVLTGRELDERGAVRKLPADEWHQRQQMQGPGPLHQ
jgi:hypothetical protein